MIHNHVPELIAIFKKYERSIWPFLMKSADAKDLDGQILYVGDRPATNYIDKLRHYEGGLRAIISVADYGMISKAGAWFGGPYSNVSLRVGVGVLTQDPSLREEIGGRLYRFLDKNPGLVRGTASAWEMYDVQSSGFMAAPDQLFARMYYLWLREIS